MKKMFPGFLILCLLSITAIAQQKPVAYINAKIIPIVGQQIEQGILLVQNGKITAVGDARTVKLSSDMTVIDATGKVIMPGLVDSHSHIGEGKDADVAMYDVDPFEWTSHCTGTIINGNVVSDIVR